MRIAVISTMEAAAWGGSEELWADVAAAALHAGHPVALFVHRARGARPRLAELAARGARVYQRGHSYRLAAERVAARLSRREVRLPAPLAISPFRALAGFRPDVVLLSEGTLFSFLHAGEACAWLRRTGTPYVSVCHLLPESYLPREAYRTRAVEFYTAAARVAFVAAGNLRTAERLLATRLEHAAVVRNPVLLRDPALVPWPARGPVRMACVARLNPGDKGQDVLLEALSAPAWRGREWRLALFGTGPEERYLRALTAHYGLGDRVELRGHAPDMRAVWAESHLLVMPSRAEGTPLALVEAMLCGRPAVGTDVGGIAEWVAEGETGFLAEAPTARSFGAALERAWASRGRWAGLGRAARDAALTLHDPDAGGTLLRMLEAATEGRRGSGPLSDPGPSAASR